MEFERTKLRITSNIAELILNRPEALNAFDLQMFQEIDLRITQLTKDKNLRVVIISAKGKDFSTGLDVKSLMKSKSGLFKLGWKLAPWQSNLAQRMSTGWQKIPCPVIAVVHGRCWGAGMQLVLGADIGIASPESVFSIMESKWGLIPDMGGSVILPSIVPRDLAFKWTALSELIDVNEALRGNLITQISSNPNETALEIANKITTQSPDAVAAAKRLYQKAYKSMNGWQLARELFIQFRLLMGKNRQIAVGNNSTNKENKVAPFAPRGPW